jgi:hypothetical protein
VEQRVERWRLRRHVEKRKKGRARKR